MPSWKFDDVTGLEKLSLFSWAFFFVIKYAIATKFADIFRAKASILQMLSFQLVVNNSNMFLSQFPKTCPQCILNGRKFIKIKLLVRWNEQLSKLDVSVFRFFIMSTLDSQSFSRKHLLTLKKKTEFKKSVLLGPDLKIT